MAAEIPKLHEKWADPNVRQVGTWVYELLSRDARLRQQAWDTDSLVTFRSGPLWTAVNTVTEGGLERLGLLRDNPEWGMVASAAMGTIAGEDMAGRFDG